MEVNPKFIHFGTVRQIIAHLVENKMYNEFLRTKEILSKPYEKHLIYSTCT